MNSIITTERIDAYCLSLLADERSAGTISKYRRDLTAFARWLDGRTVTKETAAGWKSHLSHRGYAPRTINSMLASLNSFCRFAGLPIKVKFLKIQRQIFRDSAKELTKAGRATITLKGKIRTILLPAKLCCKLMQYAKKQKIAAGEIFLTSSREGHFASAGLVRTQAAVQDGEGGADQGVPPQSAAFVRHYILPRLPGHRAPCGCPRPQ